MCAVIGTGEGRGAAFPVLCPGPGGGGVVVAGGGDGRGFCTLVFLPVKGHLRGVCGFARFGAGRFLRLLGRNGCRYLFYMCAVIGTGKGRGAAFPVLCPGPGGGGVAVTGGGDGRFRKYGFALFVTENLFADFARPVFLAAGFGAGRVLFWGVGQSAMGDGHFTGGGFPAVVRGGGGDGGGAGAYGSHCSIFTYRGNAGVAAFPSYTSIGGIVRLYCGNQSIAAVFL